MSEKKYVDERTLTTSFSGERGRIFDPIARVREALTRLTTPDKSKEFIIEGQTSPFK